MPTQLLTVDAQVDFAGVRVRETDMASEALTSGTSVPLLRWLCTHAGFPGARLPPAAELLLCAAAEAQADDVPAPHAGSGRGLERHRPGQQAALRTHTLRRAQVHFKCDNGAKV